MATIKPARKVNVAKILDRTGYGADLKRRQAQELKERQAAADRLLTTDILARKDIDAARLLFTTMGGQLRPITLDDLRVFTASAKKLGKRFKGGITAQGVINASLKEDRERSNAQIRTAVVVRAKGGKLEFITNAGPDSEEVRYHVNVEFPAFNAAAATPRKAALLARDMLDGPLKFECSCKRFRFFYRYIATVGGFVSGRREESFPKITNPSLSGIACKHALRVMHAVQKDANVRNQATKMIAAAQSNDTRAQTLTPTEQRAIAQRQAETAHHVRNKIETTAQNVMRRAAGDPAKVKALYTAIKVAAQRKVKALADGKVKPTRTAVQDVEATIASLSKLVLTKADKERLLQELLKVKTKG